MSNRLIHTKQPWMWYDSDMVTVDNDNTLILNAEIKPREIKYWNGTIYYPTYAVGTIRSIDSFGYGRYSCEILMPDGTNCWPSFWLTGTNSWPPEIDITEAWSNNCGSYFRFTIPQPPYLIPSWWATNNAHYLNEEGVKCSIGSRGISLCKLPKNPKKNYVKYECLWEPDMVTFFINGKKIRSAKNLPNLTPFMNVIFDLWGMEQNFNVKSPMKCRNFIYEPSQLPLN